MKTPEWKILLRYTFHTSVLTLLLFCGGCVSNYGEDYETEEEDESEEARFAFLRKDEFKLQQGARETLDKEQVDPVPYNEKNLTPERLKELEKNLSGEKESKIPSVKKGTPFYEDFIIFNADEKLSVSLVFNSAPVIDVLPAFADILGFNFVADAELKGTITININSNMTRRELWTTFDKMLYLSGAAAAVNESLLRILPLSKLAQQPDLILTENEESEVCYYPLKTVLAKDVAEQIKPFMGKDSVCAVLTRPNAVIISDERTNIPKIRQLLEIIDRSGKGNWPRAIMYCRNILPSKISDELKAVLPVLGFNVLQMTTSTTGANTTSTEQPGSIQLTAIDRLQILVASAATPEAVKEIRNWVEILDSSDSLDQERVFVYKVMHGKANQLIQSLSVIYNVQGSTLTIDDTTGNERTQNVTQLTGNTTNIQRNTTQNNQNNNINNARNTETDQSSNIFENPVRVFADGVLNRLVIRTTPRTYASIKALLDKLDIVPAQVLLQVLVVEVTLTESTKFGLELSGASTWGGENMTMGTNYSNLNPDFYGDQGKEKGFSFLIADPENPENKFGYIKALAGNGQVKVISSPQILVSSHTEATLRVGEDVPYVTSVLIDQGSANPTSTYTSQVDYKDTGVKLIITPQITSTDMISIEVYQELSQATTNTITSVDAPLFPIRSVETTMTIQNGKTMVIGGLIQERGSDNLESLPFINRIPFLKRLFGSTDASLERTEILVMITGYIVDEKSKVEDMIKRYNDALGALNDFDNKLGDRPGANERMNLFNKDLLDRKKEGKVEDAFRVKQAKEAEKESTRGLIKKRIKGKENQGDAE